jgi:hypothetical protein
MIVWLAELVHMHAYAKETKGARGWLDNGGASGVSGSEDDNFLYFLGAK